MKSSTKQNLGIISGKIQHHYALGQFEDETDSLSPITKIQRFKLPWSAPRSSAASGSSRVARAAGAIHELTATLPVSETESDMRTQLQGQPLGPSIVSFEVALEEIQLRQHTKTAVLEEALQRSERSQPRFWGINE